MDTLSVRQVLPRLPEPTPGLRRPAPCRRVRPGPADVQGLGWCASGSAPTGLPPPFAGAVVGCSAPAVDEATWGVDRARRGREARRGRRRLARTGRRARHSQCRARRGRLPARSCGISDADCAATLGDDAAAALSMSSTASRPAPPGEISPPVDLLIDGVAPRDDKADERRGQARPRRARRLVVFSPRISWYIAVRLAPAPPLPAGPIRAARASRPRCSSSGACASMPAMRLLIRLRHLVHHEERTGAAPRRRGLQADQRPPYHARGALAAQDQPRRKGLEF